MKNQLYILRTIFLICSAALLPQGATAQTPAPLGDVLTLETANERFLQRSLSVEAARLQVSRAEAERVAARLRPRPYATVSAENLRVSGPTPFGNLYEAGLMITQPLELGGQRRAKTELAEKSVSLAEAQLTNVIRQRQSDLRRAFYAVLSAQALFLLETSNQSNFAELVRYNTVRLEQGEISPGEALRVQLEKIKYDSAVAAAKLAVRQAKVKLLEIMGETDYSRIEQLDLSESFSFAEFPLDLVELNRIAIANRPEIKVVEADVERAQAVLRLERERGSGQIEPYTGYKRVGPDNTVVAGVNIPLPFGNRNQGEIARAEAEVKIAENALAQTRNRTASEVQSAFLAFETAREVLRAYEAGVLAQADEARNITLLSYREGATDLINLLEAQRTRNDVRAAYLRSLLDYYNSLFQLELVTGTDIRK
jgi:outer membrane protein, heavy metal efflux system